MANKKKRKKRLKRQLKRSYTPKIIKNKLLQDQTVKELPTAGLYLGKYLKENHKYQLLLDRLYAGSVQPIERFVNMKASILHTCSNCGQEWYSRPVWLLTKKNQLHICSVNSVLRSSKKVRLK
ncbi:MULTISPECIES: hypothetical protein [Terrabacteria group]|uniref:hypothetical protein n=1 Tax=Bacillati TaxID=1783272 RepID=UPI0035DC03A5